MVDPRKVAIADVLRHPVLGIVSHQPILSERADNPRLRVMDSIGCITRVNAEECTADVTLEEKMTYWRNRLKESEICE